MRARTPDAGLVSQGSVAASQHAVACTAALGNGGTCEMNAVLSRMLFRLIPTLVWELPPAISAVSAVVLHGLHPGPFYRLQHHQ
jgi:hypothetical protein